MRTIKKFKFALFFMVGIIFGFLSLNYLAFGLALVGFTFSLLFETKERNKVSFVVQRVVTRSTWKDHDGLPGYTVVQTTTGEHVLGIHGSEDGRVWAYEDRRDCNFSAFLKTLPVQIDKIVCCYPAAVKRRTGVSVPFAHEKFNRPVASSPFWLNGLQVDVTV